MHLNSAKIIGMLFGLVILPVAALAQASSYYPHAAPTRWYALPGQWIGFSGTGFAPGERIAITGTDNVRISAKANKNGAFSVAQAFVVPFAWQDTKRMFTFTGDVSRRPLTHTITVGTFYPQISPSSYWIGAGGSMSVSGISFAPGERVRMLINGRQVAQTVADADGYVSFSIQAPDSGASAILTAQGVSSGRSSTRVIYVRH